MIPTPGRHKHSSSGANRPSEVGVIVNINAEFNLMAVDPIIECFSRDLVTQYCQDLESSGVCTAPPIYVETISCRSYRSISRVLLHMHAQAIILTF
jgi:hypothetical protein